MALLNRFHQVIAAAIHRHDGMLDNIRGDGVMAVFGAPKAVAEPVASGLGRGAGHVPRPGAAECGAGAGG